MCSVLSVLFSIRDMPAQPPNESLSTACPLRKHSDPSLGRSWWFLGVDMSSSLYQLCSFLLFADFLALDGLGRQLGSNGLCTISVRVLFNIAAGG